MSIWIKPFLNPMEQIHSCFHEKTTLKSPPLKHTMYKVYLVGQIPPVSARIWGDEVDPLLLQGVQRLGDMVRQVCGILSEVPLKVRPRVGLVAHGDLVVAGVNWRQVGDGIPASESPPRCAWSFGGCAVVAAVQRYLLEMRPLQKDLKCSQLKFKNHPVSELAPPKKL